VKGAEDKPRSVDQDQVQLRRRNIGLDRVVRIEIPGDISVRCRDPLLDSARKAASNTGT
jgi:hypothetical protein